MQAEAVLGGRYRLEGVAGVGGMGTVYRALDLATGTRCALKRMAADATPRARERFVAEAAILAKVSHPAVVRYVAHGADPPFLVMEWVDGESLADRLRRGGATPADALRLAERLVRALAAIHQAGVVHRDLKPRNVMLPGGAFELAKIVDFGIARARHDAATTATGVRLGTPRYMAPEQIVSSRRVDGRADVFSLGCVLFEMLTGRRAFRGRDEVALLARMVIEDAPRVRSVRPEVPGEVDELVARMLTRDFKRRPFATDALAAEISAIATRLEDMSAANASDSESDATAEETPDELTLLASLTPLPPPSELPWATVGRDAERARLAEALAPGAVVGVWGALGIGKSHLAQTLARDVWKTRGAIVCDLRGARDEGEIVRRVAAEIGIVHAASAEDVCAAVSGRRGPLVVLDACDGLVAEAVGLAKRIVDDAPEASVLLTSRERPPLAHALELGPLDRARAVELFVARSRGAAVLPRDAAALDAVARGLQGNPLALTLAASRASLVGLEAVSSRIERPLDVLGSARTDAYPVSFREAMQSVWDALPIAEKWIAAACGIFPGPMRPDIAMAVALAASVRMEDALGGLEALRDKSFLRPAARGTLVMDPALRDLAREKLGELGERAAAAKRTFARETVARAPAAENLAELHAFEPDLFAAFDVAIETKDAELALGAALALEPSLVARGPLDRLAALLDRAIACAGESSLALARAHAARGRVAALGRDFDLAGRSFDRAIALAREQRDVDLEASTWLDVGVMHQSRGDFAAAERCYATVLDVHVAAASRSEARAQGNLGALAHDRGDLDAAYTYYVGAIAVAESIGDARLLGVFLGNLAVLDRERGRPAVARQRFVRALHALEDARERRLIGITLGNLGMLELEERRLPSALSAFERSAETLAALGDVHSEALAQARLAAALAMAGRTAAADAAIARGERLAARDEQTLAVVRFFRAFPETARAHAAGEAPAVFAERARARVAAAQPLARTNDDVRVALAILGRWAP